MRHREFSMMGGLKVPSLEDVRSVVSATLTLSRGSLFHQTGAVNFRHYILSLWENAYVSKAFRR